MAKKKRKRVSTTFQHGDVSPSRPTVSLGSDVGTVIGTERKPGMHVHYEKAECPCNGDNERCSRCDGTGYYTKEVVDQFTGTPSKPWVSESSRFGNRSIQESTFSNDQRGDIYGIRERGRYGSNPLYDDHD